MRLAVFFLGSCPGVDLAGAELLEELHHALRERGIAFRLAEARGEVRETLRRAGFEQHCFPVVANQPVATVIAEWRGVPDDRSAAAEDAPARTTPAAPARSASRSASGCPSPRSSTGPPSGSGCARGESVDDQAGQEVATHPWWKVIWLTGVDYFSTLGYQPGIALLAAGAVAPIATVILVLVTLLGALPVYAQVAGRSYAGQGSIAMLENLLAGWKGKVLVLVLLGFAATDFVITMTLSAADAAKHAIENPFLHHVLGEHQVLVTLAILAVLAAVFLKGFKEAIGLAAAAALPYLALNLVVLGRGAWEVIDAPGAARGLALRARREGRLHAGDRGRAAGLPEARAGPERLRDGRLRHAADRRRRGGPGPRPAHGRRARRAAWPTPGSCC